MAKPETDSSGLPDSYTMDQHIGEESRTLEFKNKTLENLYKNEDIPTYTSGFLNTEGGTLMIGVDDRGYVKGMELSSNSRDKFGQRVDTAMSKMAPPVPVEMYSTKFIPVDPKPQDKEEDKGHTYKDLTVICLKISKRQPGTKYQVKTGTKRGYYKKGDRSLIHLSEPDQIEEFLKQIDAEKAEELRKKQTESETETETGFDDILRGVASDITDNRKIESLGTKLGFSIGEIQTYIQSNMRGPYVTCEGTLKMLRDWNNPVAKADERSALREALKKAGLVNIADKYLP